MTSNLKNSDYFIDDPGLPTEEFRLFIFEMTFECNLRLFHKHVIKCSGLWSAHLLSYSFLRSFHQVYHCIEKVYHHINKIYLRKEDKLTRLRLISNEI